MNKTEKTYYFPCLLFGRMKNSSNTHTHTHILSRVIYLNISDIQVVTILIIPPSRAFIFLIPYYIYVFSHSHFMRMASKGTFLTVISPPAAAGRDRIVPPFLNIYAMEIYNTRWFAVLWFLIWIVTIALVVTGCRLYYRYKDAKERMKRKEEEESEQKKSELEEINNPIKQQK